MRICGVLLLAIVCLSTGGYGTAEGVFPAFPGAEGAGAYTPGGRGGRVFVVSTLADYDSKLESVIPASLRAAVEATGPRIVVFQVSGNIDLKRPLVIREPFITIAGQRAPGGGVCLRNWSLEIDTHDVVVRHLRVRPGDLMKRELDGISCSGKNVIIDHCSVSFGIDETLSTNGGSGNVTVQWCLITESLNHSVHHKGAHGYGSLISGAEPISYHHNLYAFHRSRNPRPGLGLVDFRNNVIYGWGDVAGYCGNDMLRMNYVNNYVRPAAYSKDQEYAFRPGGPNPRFFIEGNVFWGHPEKKADNLLMVKAPDEMSREDLASKMRVTAPFPVSSVSTESADAAWESVLDRAGATLPARDAYDERVLGLVRSGGGKLIDSQNDVGGWPELKEGAPSPDSDRDGMPDDWEQRFGLNANDSADAALDCNGDGFTNIEKYLDGLDPTKPFPWIYPPVLHEDSQQQPAGPVTVTLGSASKDVVLKYTIDGSEPAMASDTYSGPFTLTRTGTVRAIAFLNGESSHVTNQYIEVLPLHEAADVPYAVQGLDYTYYENGNWKGFPDLDSLTPLKIGVTGMIGTGPSAIEAGYGLKFTGYLRVDEEGVYTFHGRSTELSRFAVDGVTLVMTQSRKRECSGRIALRRGFHAIEASIYLGTPDKNKTFEVSYEGPGVDRRIIPAQVLFRAEKN